MPWMSATGGFSPLNFYGSYDDGAGNALEVGDTQTSFARARPHTDKWPLIIRKSVSNATTTAYDLVFLRLLRGYNNKPSLHITHGQRYPEPVPPPNAPKTWARFISDTYLIAPGQPTSDPIGFQFPNIDLGGDT